VSTADCVYGLLALQTRLLASRLALGDADTERAQLIDPNVLEAKRLLVHSQLPIASINHQLGFDEATNFFKYFKRDTGTTPNVFRSHLGPHKPTLERQSGESASNGPADFDSSARLLPVQRPPQRSRLLRKCHRNTQPTSRDRLAAFVNGSAPRVRPN
jgi:hypothetical protein